MEVTKRVSVRRDDPGYVEWRRLGEPFSRVKVFVDGEETKEAITADPELGYVLANKLNDENRAFVDPETGHVAVHELYGDVKVKLD